LEGLGDRIATYPLPFSYPESGLEDGFADGWLSLSYVIEPACQASLLLQI